MIETVNLSRKYGQLTAVDDVTFKIGKGEVFGFLGPNGAGKTTTIRMLACLISPTHGTATVAGYNIQKNPIQVRQSVGILTENPSLYENLTAYENMDFFAQAYGIADPADRQKRIQELLEFFNLWDRRNDKAGTFSKGMKQKLAIIRATVHKPSVLFLDEPTAGLDPESAKEIRDLMAQLSKHEKCTILLSTHHLEDAEKLCNRVLLMNKGRCLLIGKPDELREQIVTHPIIQIDLTQITNKILQALNNSSHVQEINTKPQETSLMISVKDIRMATPEIVKTIVEADGQILGVNTFRASLEDAYLKLIKGETETQ
ncbi:MAG: ABC transporter ATP-binding protein [Candidatus Bathyarchaeota archaeon]|nr:ABC transporter ATP-binding protein [Candidatus Termiticorpusculum sp.]